MSECCVCACVCVSLRPFSISPCPSVILLNMPFPPSLVRSIPAFVADETAQKRKRSGICCNSDIFALFHPIYLSFLSFVFPFFPPPLLLHLVTLVSSLSSRPLSILVSLNPPSFIIRLLFLYQSSSPVVLPFVFCVRPPSSLSFLLFFFLSFFTMPVYHP